MTKTIARLLTEHLQIGGALIAALRDGKTTDAERLSRQWYLNADQMAEAFFGINPHYDREMLRKMLYRHLELTTRVVAAHLSGNDQTDISTTDASVREAVEMADYFTAGLLLQFPLKFV